MMSPLTKEVGQGAFGVVHEALSPIYGRTAIKLYRPIKAEWDTADARNRFKREVKVQSTFNHRNIVPILDSDLEADQPWFEMPFAERTLLQVINEKTRNIDELQKALLDVLAGMEELARLGFKHRDLKPGNVLQFKDAEGQTYYAISDLGLIASDLQELTTITHTGQGGGTPIYAAPECMLKLSAATLQSDIYSFGAILHDIYVNTSRMPCQELTGPGKIGEVIELCTKRNPLRRYSTIEDLRSALVEAWRETIVIDSPELAKLTGLLSEARELTEEEWDSICIYITEATEADQLSLFRFLDSHHFVKLADQQNTIFLGLARLYVEHVLSNDFSFNYCDVLAVKLVQIYELGDLELKAISLLALLRLGTSHNRWFVEHKFMDLAGDDLDDNVVERLLLEAELRGLNFNAMIKHVERSIGADLVNLHAQLLIQSL